MQQSGFYGWPHAYVGNHPQPGFASLAPENVNQTIVPGLLFEAHSSVLDFVFYEGDQFSAISFRPSTRASAFVALKGSWNRSAPTGYKVVRVPFNMRAAASSYTLIPSGVTNSSRRISPGCTGGGRRRPDAISEKSTLRLSMSSRLMLTALPSMIVDGLDTPTFAVAPNKADLPLVVDANASLTLAVAGQRLQTVAGWRAARQVASLHRLQEASRGRDVESGEACRARHVPQRSPLCAYRESS